MTASTSLPKNGRDLRIAREELQLSRVQFAAVLGTSCLSVLPREYGLLPVNATLASLTDAFKQGFRPDNWPSASAA